MRKIYFLLLTVLFATVNNAQTVFITTGTAGTPAYNAGPVYRSAAASAFDASRYTYLYTVSELAAAGITPGSVINLVGWVKNNTATSLGVGGIFRIYMKNTSAVSFSLASETWANLNAGAVMVYENLTQVIPATANPTYIDFPLTTSFTYTGGSLEISTEWDINQVAGNGSTGTFDWLWSTVVDRIYGTGNTTLAPITTLSSTTNSISTIDDRRPFIKITYTGGTTGIDIGAQSLVTPAVSPGNCYTSAETVTIRIRNYSTNPINFSVNPAIVTTNVTGAVTQTLTAVVNAGTLAPAATVDVPMTGTLNMNATGVYTFNASAVVTGDVTPSNNAMTAVNITKAVLAPGTASVSPGSLCLTGTPVLSTTGATGYGGLQWQQSTTPGVGFTDIPGATTSPYTLASPITQTMYFRLLANCNGNTVTSNEVTVTVNSPQVTGTTPGASCGPGPVTVTLGATGSAGTTLNWYAAVSGGLPIGTGSSFTTPPISANTTYYVSASTGGGTANLGLPAQIAGTSGFGTTNFGLVFDALVPFTLNSVVLYPVAAAAGTPGTVTIDVINSAGTILNTATVNVIGNPTATANTVTLNFNIAAGTNLKLRPGSRSASITALLFEPSATAPPGGNYGYPFVVPGVVSINHSTLTAAPANTARLDLYYYFYNWTIATGCESARTAVLATVTTPPAATITYVGSPYCNTGGTATVTRTGTPGGTYSSTAGLTLNATTGDVTLGSSTPGTYTVTYTIAAGGGCPAFTTTASITVSVCAAGNVTVTASAGTPGPTPYNTVKEAFDAINAGTHQGNIVVNVNANTDEGATPAVLNSSGTGSAVYTSVLLRPTADGLSVVGSATPSSRGIIELNGTDNVTIDGDNPNTAGTNRNLTFSLTAANASVLIWLKTPGAADGCLGNTIKNCNLTGQGTYTSIAGVIAGGSTFGGAALAPNSNNTIQNNAIIRTQNGLYQNGFATTPFDENWQVKNNSIGSSVLADKLGFRGMILINASGYLVDNNTIMGINSSVTTTSTMTGIQLGTGNLNGTISNNKISDIRHNNTTGWGSNGIWLNGSTVASNTNVYNNMISDVASYGFNGVSATDNGYGMLISTGGGYNVYYNTIVMNTNQTSATGLPAALNVTNGITTANTLNIRDNLIVNTQTVGTERYAVYSGAAASVYTDINYNDYHFTGPNLGNIGGTVRANLAAWQTGTGKDANSISVAPVFVSATDLHLVAGSNCGIDGKGQTITVPPITTDIDGNTRHATTPDIGADEFNGNSAATIVYAGSPYCITGGTATVTRTGTAGGTYSSTVGLTINATTGDVTLGTSTPGTYTVTYTIAAGGGCPIFTTTASITIIALANATIVYAGSPYCTTGGTATVTRIGTAGGTYSSTPGLTINPTNGDVTLGTSTPGTYTVTYTIAPGGGCPTFTTTTSITVNAAPTVTCPANIITSTAPNLCSAVVSYSPTSTGSPAPALTYTFTGATTGSGSGSGSGSTFNVGTTTVNITATNSCGTASCSFTVRVNDTQFPAITCPATVTVSCASAVPAVSVSSVTATDNCPGVVVTHISDVISAQTCANRYTLTRRYRATDASGNFTECTQIITVNDQTAPVITCPANITVNTPVGSCTAVVSFTVTATDNCAGAVTIVSSPASGSVFPIGTTTVTSTATDACGNSSTCTFTVTVVDIQLPVISVQPVNRTVCAGASATFSVTSTNAVSYQWQQWNGTAWVNIAGTNAPTFTVSNTTVSMNTNTFRVIVNGLCTPVPSNAATLFVNPLPTVVITANPPSPLLPTQTTTLNASANPPGGSFTWFHNGTAVPGVSGPALGPLGVDDIGTYHVIYNLGVCTVTSASFVLSGAVSSGMWVYPNPNRGVFTVRFFNQANEPATVNVYNAAGQKVYQKEVVSGGTAYSQIEVNLGFKANGVYIVQVVNGSGQILGSQRIVVQSF